MQESDKVFKVLLSPQEASVPLLLEGILPPLAFEQALYLDIIDTFGNYITIR
jgi:hypothetical protein